MVETPHPLLEKMTLFWRGHFAFNAEPVKDARLMQRHVGLLRAHALGSFSSLLHAVWQDPALLLALGAEAHRRAAPTEALVRPLMESFTLGTGSFAEKDVHEAARAFAGWFVLRGEARLIPGEQDRTVKQVLGEEGDLGADDVIRILLEQPATAQTLVRRLCRWLLSETADLDPVLVAPLAESFARDYNVSRLVETFLRSNLFFSSLAYRSRIKGPVEYAVGIIRVLEGTAATLPLAQTVADLGQDPISLPTVKGWRGGPYWITTPALVLRHNLALALVQGQQPYGARLDPWALAQRHGFTTPESAAGFLLDLLVPGDLDPPVREALLRDVRTGGGDDPRTRLVRLAYAAMTQPEFQLG
jgi:uncharacterized protein (DUF1800 family)